MGMQPYTYSRTAVGRRRTVRGWGAWGLLRQSRCQAVWPGHCRNVALRRCALQVSQAQQLLPRRAKIPTEGLWAIGRNRMLL